MRTLRGSLPDVVSSERSNARCEQVAVAAARFATILDAVGRQQRTNPYKTQG